MSEILKLLSYIKLIGIPFITYYYAIAYNRIYYIVYTYYSERFRTFKNNNYILETWLSNYVL